MDLLSHQQVTCVLIAETANNKPATLDGIPEWSTSNPAVATVHPDPSGWNCLVKAASPGTTTITAYGDAALDPNVQRILTATLDVHVSMDEAVTLTIQAGNPEEQ